MLTKGRAGLLNLDWVRLSVIAILLCIFIVHSSVKWVGVQPITRREGFWIEYSKFKEFKRFS